MRLFLLGGALVVAVLGSALAAQEQPLEPAQQVRQLVRALDADRRADRDRAERALIELGPDILPLLPEVTPRTPAEVKERLGRVVQTLEKQLAARAVDASRVTLSGKMSLGEALAALEKQTGNRVAGVDQSAVMVQVDFAKAPYWEALDRLLDQAGLTTDPYGGADRAITVRTRAENQRDRFGTASYAGLFRVEATRVETNRDLRNPELEGLRVRLEIAWEPRATPISLAQPLSQLEALDVDGNPIAVDGPEGVRTAMIKGELAGVEMDIPFQLPARSVEKIATLKGTLNAMVPGRLESFKFEDLTESQDTQQRKAGVVVKFQRIYKNEDLYEVRMLLRYDEANNALESHRGWVFNNPAYLLDGQGKRVDYVGSNVTQQDVSEIGLGFLFDLEEDPKQYTFVYETPALILQMPVSYELKDIALP